MRIFLSALFSVAAHLFFFNAVRFDFERRYFSVPQNSGMVVTLSEYNRPENHQKDPEPSPPKAGKQNIVKKKPMTKKAAVFRKTAEVKKQKVEKKSGLEKIRKKNHKKKTHENEALENEIKIEEKSKEKKNYKKHSSGAKEKSGAKSFLHERKMPARIKTGIKNRPPPYPALARKRGYEGTALLDILVDKRGKVKEIKISSSSGYRILDNAAVKAAKKWLFAPGSVGNEIVEMRIRAPVRFRLTDN